ncbi:MAG: hypothetical protein ABI477_14560 [Chryseolinea sp.]
MTIILISDRFMRNTITVFSKKLVLAGRWLLLWGDIKMAMLSMTISGHCPALLGYYHFNKLIPLTQIDVYAEEVSYTDNAFFDDSKDELYIAIKAGVVLPQV